MSQVPISALPPLATPLNPALQLEVAQGTTTSSKVTLAQILTDPIITGSPTITDFTLALHDHSNNINGGQLTNSALVTGEFTAITGLGIQTTALSMGVNNILQLGFLELREITIPDNPAETAGRLYTRDVAGNTILFFLNSLGVETDLLDIGTGTFLPLAGGTMDDGAAIAFENTGDGPNPTISVIPSAGQTLTISDNLSVPTTIFLGSAGWRMTTDADTDFSITTPEGDGSHNFDIISETGEISLQNTTTTNDFTAKFFVEQLNPLSTNDAIALTIEAQIVDGTDTGEKPVIAINARQAAADIDTRPIFGILNNGNQRWEISKDGDVTQFGDLNMVLEKIILNDWEIFGQVANNDLRFKTISGNDGTISFITDEMTFQFIIASVQTSNVISQQTGGDVDTKIVYQTFIGVIPDNDPISNTTPIYDIRIQREGAADIINRPLIQVRNHLTTEWLLDNDGTVTQSGNLLMGSNQIQFVDINHRIDQVANNMEIHTQLEGNTTLFLGGTFYRFDKTKADWEKKNILNMNQIAFSNPTSSGSTRVAIQRGDAAEGGNNASLEFDANLNGELVLRIFGGSTHDEEYNFGATAADFHDNQINNVGQITFTGTTNAIFPKDSNTNLRINATTDIECEVGNGGSFVISNRSGANLFSFSSDRADFLGSDLADMGILSYQSEITTLATDILTPDKTFTIVAAQTGTTDDLTTINILGAVAGQTLLIKPDTGDTITVNDTGNIKLINDFDFFMDETRKYMGLIFDGTDWIELFRNGNHILAITGSDGITAVTNQGITNISVNSTVISGQTPEIPLNTDSILFQEQNNGPLRKAIFDDLQWSMIAGIGEGHSIGQDTFLSFFSNASPGSALNKGVIMPATIDIRNLHVRTGNNGKSENTVIAVAVNGVPDGTLFVTANGGVDNEDLAVTGARTIIATQKISLSVKAAAGSGTIEIISFSCLLGQRSV